MHHAMLCQVNAEMPFSDKQPRSAGVPYIISCSVGIRVAPLTWRGGKCIRLHRIHLVTLIHTYNIHCQIRSINTNTCTMGLFSNYSPQQELHPVNPPLGIYPNFTAKQPTMLTLREHAFTFSGVGQVSQVSILTTFTSGNRSDV